VHKAPRPPREKYEPPVVRKVKLVAEELAVAGCKSQMVSTNVCRRGVQLFNRTQGS
jgi:hypothetical protein